MILEEGTALAYRFGDERPLHMMDSHSTTAVATPARTCRVLYFGPPGSGKTANLVQIASCVPQAYRVPVAGSGGGERFSFRVDAGDLGPWIVEAVVADAAAVGVPVAAGRGFPFDGVVFVADSCADRLDLNLSAIETLKTDLEAGGFDLTSLPMVIQYNRQDAPGRLPVDRLESLLNPWGMPSFPAIAAQGVGVRETLRAVLGLTMRQLDRTVAAAAETDGTKSGCDHTRGRDAGARVRIAGDRRPRFRARSPCRRPRWATTGCCASNRKSGARPCSPPAVLPSSSRYGCRARCWSAMARCGSCSSWKWTVAVPAWTEPPANGARRAPAGVAVDPLSPPRLSSPTCQNHVTQLSPPTAIPPRTPAAEWFALGQRAEGDGDLDAGRRAYAAAVARDPRQPEWHYRLGCVSRKLGLLAEAAVAFRRAAELAPEEARHLLNLGTVLDRLGQREEAVRSYQAALSRDPRNAEAHNNLGAIHAEAGRPEEAVRAFEAAIAARPDAQGWQNLGLVHFHQDDFERALHCFEQALLLAPDSALGHYYAGLCQMRKGLYREATLRFRRAFELDARLGRAEFHAGACLHKVGRYDEALLALQRALESFPEDPRLHYQLGLTCDALLLHQEARQHYRHARAVNAGGFGGTL